MKDYSEPAAAMLALIAERDAAFQKGRDSRSDQVLDLMTRAHDAEKRLASMTAVLEECEDYFDNRADADADQDGYIPNAEMNLLTAIRWALKS